MSKKLLAAALIFVSALAASAQDAATPHAPLTPQKIPLQPFIVERFVLPGPVTGVAIKIDLEDPRVHVKVALADNHDPDGDGPSVGQLDTPSNVARKQDFQITLNVSYFSIPLAREFAGQKIRYFVGNGAYPVGWHFSDNKLISAPAQDSLRATLIVHQNGKVTIRDQVRNLPADTQFAVSGNAMMLANGHPTPPVKDAARNPRSAVGISSPTLEAVQPKTNNAAISRDSCFSLVPSFLAAIKTSSPLRIGSSHATADLTITSLSSNTGTSAFVRCCFNA